MTQPPFEHQRHKPPSVRETDRQLVILCPVLRSRVNLSRIVRVAGCFGVRRIIAGRPFSIDPDIARAATDFVQVQSRGALLPVLKKLRDDGFQLVGLEQTTNARSLFEFQFPEKTALLLGHERNGIPADELAVLNAVVEIPVYGKPDSYNVASAATMAIYEYCRQHP